MTLTISSSILIEIDNYTFHLLSIIILSIWEIEFPTCTKVRLIILSDETLGERINFIRTRRGIRISDLAEMIKIPVFDKSGNVINYKSYTKTSLSLIENNKQRPSIDVVTAISDILGVSIDWLARGVEYEGKKLESLGQEKLRFLFETTSEEDLNKFDEFIRAIKQQMKEYDGKIDDIEKRLTQYTEKKEDS
ncbi:hypothetical protein C0638_01300 [Paenibacillus sp. lzh-N1]|nr:hypothetical protein C0638_01300 [Paenibacillus sp. lzh-N1]